MTETVKKTLRDSAAMRWTALLLLALAMFCSYIFMDILSPIKDLMQETRGWDSTAFGTMQGSEVFLNVFVFFLIFAGIILAMMLSVKTISWAIKKFDLKNKLEQKAIKRYIHEDL